MLFLSLVITLTPCYIGDPADSGVLSLDAPSDSGLKFLLGLIKAGRAGTLCKD